MKTLLLLTFAMLAHAAPVLTCSGYCSPIEGGYFLDLAVYPDYWNLPARSATITSSEPLQGIGLYVDNLPFLAGSGFKISIDGEQVYDAPADHVTQESLYLTIAHSFTQVEFTTREWFGWTERMDVLVEQVVPATVTPEPGTWALGLAGLAVIYGRRRAR